MKARHLIILVVFLVFIGTIMPAYAQTRVDGTANIEELLVIADQNGKVLGVYPSDFYIEFVYTHVVGVNETGNVEYKIISKKWEWLYPPPTEVYLSDLNATVKLRYDVELVASTGSNSTMRGNETVSSAAVGVFLTVKIYIDFVSLPFKVGSIDIGRMILKDGFQGFPPVIYYEVVAEKYRDGEYETTEYISDYVELHMENVVVNLYSIVFDIKNIEVEKYVEQGELDQGVVITPRYKVTVCGNIVGNISRTMQVVASIGGSETTLTIDSDPEPECGELKDIQLLPGPNQSILVSIRSGVFNLLFNMTKNVEGSIITLSRPSGRVIGHGNTWEALITLPVLVSGHYDSWPKITVSGSVSNSYFGTIPCQSLEITSEGTYTLVCDKTITATLSVPEILNSDFDIRTTVVDELGITHSFTGKVSMDALDPSNIADVAWNVYEHAFKVLVFGMIGIIGLLFVSIIKEYVTGTPLIDPGYLRGALLTITVALVILQVALPIVYDSFTSILANMPLFQKYVNPPPASDPKTVFTYMIGYYEKTFQAIERDYQQIFMTGINEITGTMFKWLAGAIVILLAALAASAWFGAGIPFASIGQAILSVIFAFLGLIILLAPAGSIVLIGVVIGRLVIIMVTAVVITMMTLGVILICIPSSLAQKLGEDFFGAGLLYFIVFPILGPITYTLYSYVIETASRVSVGSINMALGVVNIILPIDPIVKIMVFFIASGVTMLMIIMSLSYILTRTGIATGIGEALSGLVWRV